MIGINHKLVAWVILLALALTLTVGASTGISTGTALAAGSAISSVQNGNWSDPTIWSGGVPEADDAVTIEVGHTVLYDLQSDTVLGGVTILGTLSFSRLTPTRLKTSDNIFVGPGSGYLDVGTEGDPIPAGAPAEIIFVLPQNTIFNGGPAHDPNDVGLWAMMDSQFTVHGAPRLHTWSKLSQDSLAGADPAVVTVESDVTD